MIGIQAIGSYVPRRREDNVAKGARFNMTPDFVREKIGVLRVARAADGEFSSHMCMSAFDDLRRKVQIDAADIDCIVVCTQNPDNGGIPHVASLVHGGIGGADACACFDLGLGCSGYVYGLSITRSFMEANGFKRGLLFTSDPYSKIVDPADRNTSLLFGDAATVTLLSEEGDWLPIHFMFGTQGRSGGSLRLKDRVLEMNGRAVFNFSATVVPDQIRRLLQQRDLTAEDVDLYFFHQGSRYIIDTLAVRLGIPSERVPEKLADQGNTVSSSIPLMLGDFIGQSRYQRFLLSGFGVGLSWASCLLENVSRAKYVNNPKERSI